MALVTTILSVIGVLGGMALLLWFSAFVESRQLGPIVVEITDPEPIVASPASPVAA